MTDDDILRMAREAGGAWEYRRTFPVPCVMYDEELLKFARLVVAAERETPPRQWQGLTKREFLEAVDGLEDLEDCWVAIEDKLKEKNG